MDFAERSAELQVVDTVTSGNWIKIIKQNVSSTIDLTKELVITKELVMNSPSFLFLA